MLKPSLKIYNPLGYAQLVNNNTDNRIQLEPIIDTKEAILISLMNVVIVSLISILFKF